MSVYCDVALPVPLDRAFTYELRGLEAEVGARVLVPFAGQRLVGVVVAVHDAGAGGGWSVEVKRGGAWCWMRRALLPDELMELAKWIAGYYVAPLGEVLRGMLPLTAEVRRQWVYRIGGAGRKVLYEAAKGSSRRSKLSVEEQNREYAVLNYLESGESGEGGGDPVGYRGEQGAAGWDGEEEVAGAGAAGGGAGCAAGGDGGGAGGGEVQASSRAQGPEGEKRARAVAEVE